MMTTPPSRTAPRDTAPFSLRIDDALREQLQASANRNGRSLSAEITMRLRSGLESETRQVSRFETGAPSVVYGDDGAPQSVRLPREIDLDLLQQSIAGASTSLEGHGLSLSHEKFALLVSLLYTHFASGRPVDSREFSRFIALIA